MTAPFEMLAATAVHLSTPWLPLEPASLPTIAQSCGCIRTIPNLMGLCLEERID